MVPVTSGELPQKLVMLHVASRVLMLLEEVVNHN